VTECLLKRFPPEFVNRIDHIEAFDWIDVGDMPKLVAVELARLNRRLLKHECIVEIDGDVADFIATRGFDPRFGARGLRRAMRQHLEFPLAEYLLALSAERDAAKVNVLVLKARLNGDRLNFGPS